MNELIEDAVAKSMSELRAAANSIVLERMGGGNLKQDVQQVTAQVWHEITQELDQIRADESEGEGVLG